MGIVIGQGGKFYSIPEEVLTKYVMSEKKIEKIRENMKGRKVKVEAEVEGYTAQKEFSILDIFEMAVSITTESTEFIFY